MSDLHVTGSFESGIDTWATASANLTGGQDSGWATDGTQSFKVTRINTAGIGQVFSGTAVNPKMACAPGERVNVSAWLIHSIAAGTPLTLRHRYYNANTLVSENDAVYPTTSPNTPTFISHTNTVPAGVDGMQVAVFTSTMQIGETFSIDDVQARRVGFGWAPTTTDILNLDGVHRRTDRFRFELCDRDLRPIGDLHPAQSGAPVITNDMSNNTPRRMTGFKLTADQRGDINPVTDRLRVYMTLQNGAEFRLGTFLWAASDRPLRSWGQEEHDELVDLSHILNQESTQIFSFDRGVTITLAMFFLLFRAGFELADIRTIGHEAARSLADPKSWQPGTTWTTMLNDLGVLVGFAAPWLDRDGRVMLDNPPDPAYAAPTVPAYEEGTRIITDSVLYGDDMLSAPNDFGVFDSGTDRIRTGRYQLPSSAPYSFARRGYRVGKTENTQGITDQAMANRAARNLALTSDAFETVSFQSTADPRHDSYDIVDFLGERWLETSWTLELRSGGPMTHNLKRVTYDVR